MKFNHDISPITSEKKFIFAEHIEVGQREYEKKIKNFKINNQDKKMPSENLYSKNHNSKPEKKNSLIDNKKEIEPKRITYETERKLVGYKNNISDEKNEGNNRYNKITKKLRKFSNNLKQFSSSIKKSIISNSNKSSSEMSSNNFIFEETPVNMNDKCLICDEELTQKEKIDNLIHCLHMFCNDCYYMYIKEKINSYTIEGIKCPAKDCHVKLYDEFIERKLYSDIELLNKYISQKRKKQLMINPNIQLCPHSGCDSYAKKDKNTKFVQCIKNKHKFCFNCLKEWHENEKCDNSIDKSFEKWKDSNKVKRCPKCGFFIEKNEGCNHIRCSNCKCEFCWFCSKECTYEHFERGRCAGLLYSNNKCCNNTIINFLYRLLIAILKSLALGIGLPFINAFIMFYSFAKEYNKSNELSNIIVGFSGVLTCLNFIIYRIPLSLLLGIISLFYWPLQDTLYESNSKIFMNPYTLNNLSLPTSFYKLLV